MSRWWRTNGEAADPADADAQTLETMPIGLLDVVTTDVVDSRRGSLITKETSGRSGGA